MSVNTAEQTIDFHTNISQSLIHINLSVIAKKEKFRTDISQQLPSGQWADICLCVISEMSAFSVCYHEKPQTNRKLIDVIKTTFQWKTEYINMLPWRHYSYNQTNNGTLAADVQLVQSGRSNNHIHNCILMKQFQFYIHRWR